MDLDSPIIGPAREPPLRLSQVQHGDGQRQVAEYLGVSKATIYGLCERGELPYVWVVTSIRIRPRDLEEFIAASVTVADEPRRHKRKPS